MAFELLELGLGIAEILHFALESAFGWRYLLSPTYRRRVHVRWRSQPGMDTALEITGGVIGLVATGAGAVWLGIYFLR